MDREVTVSDSALHAFETADKADAWDRGKSTRDDRLGAATALMLDLALIGPGDHVLDIAAGTGDQSVLAAQRVGPSGLVLATDISAPILEVAARRAQEGGLTNIQIRVLDAQNIDLDPESFDSAISRLGIMLLPDVGAALRGVIKILRPGGRFSAMVFSTPERNPLSSIPQEVLRQYGAQLPGGGDPPAYSLSAPGLLEQTLTKAGFRDVDVQAVPIGSCFTSERAGVQYLQETSPAMRDLAAQLSEHDRDAAWAEIEHRFRPFESERGFEAPGEMLVGVGTK
jgi:ubiquinone/menaquinone biosynthesis C-methylase UbiE